PSRPLRAPRRGALIPGFTDRSGGAPDREPGPGERPETDADGPGARGGRRNPRQRARSRPPVRGRSAAPGGGPGPAGWGRDRPGEGGPGRVTAPPMLRGAVQRVSRWHFLNRTREGERRPVRRFSGGAGRRDARSPVPVSLPFTDRAEAGR